MRCDGAWAEKSNVPIARMTRCNLKWRGRIWVIAGGLLAALAVGFSGWHLSRQSEEELLQSAKAALNRGANDDARRVIHLALNRFPESARTLLAAGEIELALGRPEDALAFFAQVEYDGSPAAVLTAMKAGNTLLGLRRVSEAESYFRQVLTTDPENLVARRRLARLLMMAGRREAADHYLELVRHGDFNTNELALLGNLENYFAYPDLDTVFDATDNCDRQIALGAAHFSLHLHRIGQAERQFRRLAMDEPGDVDAQAGWGVALAEIGTADEFFKWHRQLPREADTHPAIWVSRARWAEKINEPDVAVRCYWEATQRDPNDWMANNRLGLLLRSRGEGDLSQAFLDRSQRLKRLLDALYTLHMRPERRDLMLEAATLCESLGRLWEACGWYRAAGSLKPERPDLQREVRRLRQLIHRDSPQTLLAADRALQIDLSRFPLPAWPSNSPSHESDSHERISPVRAQVEFVDRTTSAGIDFTYFNGKTSAADGLPMMPASMGGGVAVLDYDGDGWPDLHLTQGCEWPPQPAQTRHLDRLFRNRGNGAFVDVTSMAGVGDDRYSRGVTVGDYDSDGFADLYIANVGLNRLYRNNGDGTFEDASGQLGNIAEIWTASCLLADLNGDGLPDLYDVTYLDGNSPMERVCHDDVKGSIRACTPRVFEAARDRLLLNAGDGTFTDFSEAAGITTPEGKGLGIVAARFRDDTKLDLFVANDTTPNLFFVNATPTPAAVPVFDERALISGCAYDSLGRALASMGVAIDDVNADGLFDLYVTTFYHEGFRLFLGQPGEQFADRTGEAGLKEPSLEVLGFGTQFLDADLDGWPDLIVTNGHIDDLTEMGTPFRMPAQFYRNRGGGRFEELRPAELGEFFTRRQLGRGLARLDFNRDGREDFVVSHLDTPAALVSNETSNAGHFICLQFRGVESSRDAIGTIIRISAAGRTQWKQLTAGDGYQASNQRQLVVGLGTGKMIDQLVVRWPSGREQHFSDVAVDAEYILVEGGKNLIPQTIH